MRDQNRCVQSSLSDRIKPKDPSNGSLRRTTDRRIVHDVSNELRLQIDGEHLLRRHELLLSARQPQALALRPRPCRVPHAGCRTSIIHPHLHALQLVQMFLEFEFVVLSGGSSF